MLTAQGLPGGERVKFVTGMIGRMDDFCVRRAKMKERKKKELAATMRAERKKGRAAAEEQHRAAFRGKVWFDDTIQTIDHAAAEEVAGTPKKDEAYDGRFEALNTLKVDFQKRRDHWVRATPGKDRPFCYTDPHYGDVELRVGERAHVYAQHRRGIDLPFDGR